MIQEQLTFYTTSTPDPPSTHHIIQQILRTKYHNGLINCRYQLIFDQFYGHYCHPADGYERWAFDVLVFSSAAEQLKKLYKMQEVASTIRGLILARLKRDPIAPILRKMSPHRHAPGRQERRYRLRQEHMPQSNTMHTETSQKKSKCRLTRIQKIITSEFDSSDKNDNKGDDFSHSHSHEMLSKVSQDLSRMIRNVCVEERKRVSFPANFFKELMPKPVLGKDRDFKRLLTEENISIIKSDLFQNNFTYNYEEPQQNYGLKKFKKNNTKSKNQKIKPLDKRKTPQIRRQVSDKKRKQSSIGLSPLTPKPVSVSKSKWGWEDSNNKCSRFSLKSRVSSHKKLAETPKMPKSPPTKIKAAKPLPKSPIKPILKPPLQ